MWLCEKHVLEKTPSVFGALPLRRVGKRWSLAVLSPTGGKGSTCQSLIILLSFFPSLLFFNKSLRTTCFSLVVCFSRVQPLFEILEQECSSKYGQPTCNYPGMSTLPLSGFALVNQSSSTPLRNKTSCGTLWRAHRPTACI